MKKILAALSLAVLASTAVMAQDASTDMASADSASMDMSSGIYGEIGFTGLRGDNDKLFSGGSFRPTMLRGLVGTSFTPWLNGELMLGLGVNGDKVLQLAPSPTSVNAEVKTLVGLYATPTLKLSGGKLFARIGYANITYSDAKLPAAGPLAKQGIFSKHDSISWGFGGSFDLGSNLSLNADYMQYYKRKNEKLDGFTVGLGYKF